jgi:hypothetical protein
MISLLVDSLERQGFTVCADHVGDLRPKPAPLGDYVPDVEARKGSCLRLIEVETASTIDLPETRAQLNRLTAAMGTAFLAVPFDSIGRARDLRDELSVDLGILPCYPFIRYVGSLK